MKYDILLPFRDYLNQTCKSKETAKRYYFATKKLLAGIHFDSLAELDPALIDPALISDKLSATKTKALIEKRLSATKTRHDLSAAKNGLKRLEEFCKENTDLLPDNNFFSTQSKDNKKKEKLSRNARSSRIIRLDRTRRKTNALTNDKIKLAYRLMMVSGLRVSETAALTKQDISIDGDGRIEINVRHGKGDKSGQIICMNDPYLARRLSGYLAGRRDCEKIFYSAATMQKRAGKLGIECHDLRRIAANTFRRQRMASGVDKYDANKQTSEFLKHERFATTKRYLMGFNHKLIIKK